uniref:Putative secreted peptide n=1 Tax=Anopheles braziliensis TaxID=58242 RepID=A0A2M3ZQZ7_9DIPT
MVWSPVVATTAAAVVVVVAETPEPEKDVEVEDDDVYVKRMTRGNEKRSRNWSATRGSVRDSVDSFEPLLSPVEQSPPPPPPPDELRELSL